ncbi:MAG: hypothetical protein R3E79_32170 [Caldilineaceae bacterium]
MTAACASTWLGLQYPIKRCVVSPRLGLRLRAAAKAEWIIAIAGWQAAATAQRWLAATHRRLIPRWQQCRPTKSRRSSGLSQAGAPGYGAGAGTPPPWQAPATVNEELYYSGLLFPLAPATLKRARP